MSSRAQTAKKKSKTPEAPKVRTWESLEKKVYSPERIAKNRAAGVAIALEQQMRELRENCGLTQVQVAKRMGITQATLSQLENRGDAKISTVKAFAEALGGHLRVVIDLKDGPVTIALGT